MNQVTVPYALPVVQLGLHAFVYRMYYVRNKSGVSTWLASYLARSMIIDQQIGSEPATSLFLAAHLMLVC